MKPETEAKLNELLSSLETGFADFTAARKKGALFGLLDNLCLQFPECEQYLNKILDRANANNKPNDK